jgi:hypothetical protein
MNDRQEHCFCQSGVVTSFDNENGVVTSTLSVEVIPEMKESVRDFEENELVHMKCYVTFSKREGRLRLLVQSMESISTITLSLN